jgi:hypothetical protein
MLNVEKNNKQVDIPLLDYKIGDGVYVYSKELFQDYNFMIDKNMIGTIISFEQKKYEDIYGSEYIEYAAKIELNSKKIITIKDESTQALFRKYEFIAIKELKFILNKANNKSQNALKFLEKSMT